MEVEEGKARKGGEGIGEGVGHETGEGFIGGLGGLEAPGTGEGVEEAGGAGDGEGGSVGFLKEHASAGFVFEDAGDAEAEPCGVREFRAGAQVGQEVCERAEKRSGERREVGRELQNRKNKFRLTYSA